MNENVFILTLGCPKNSADSEGMAYLLNEAGFTLTADENEADIILINTCCFVGDAKEESVDVILSAALLKKENPHLKIAVCGCLAQRYAHELKQEIPEVDYFIGTAQGTNIAKILSGEEKPNEDKLYLSDINSPAPETGRLCEDYTSYAYIKIAEGCNKHCTYCVIPKIKGEMRSRKMEPIVEEARLLAENEGKSEIILVAQDTGAYGTDCYGKRMIAPLIKSIAEIEAVRWIRLLYVYPEEVDDELIEAFENCDKLIKYIDIPLQHINDEVLKLMNRRTTKADIIALIEKLRSRVPDIAIRSTFIAGFPQESRKQAEELRDFLAEARLTRAGVFAYSCEENTPAAEMSGQISEEEKLSRRDMLMQTQMEVSEQLLAGFIGKKLTAVVEGLVEEGLYIARSYIDSPDIDGCLYIKSEKPLEENEYYEVTITDSTEYDLWGEIN